MPREANLARKISKKHEKGIPESRSKKNSMPREVKIVCRKEKRAYQGVEAREKVCPEKPKRHAKRKKGIPESRNKRKSMSRKANLARKKVHIQTERTN